MSEEYQKEPTYRFKSEEIFHYTLLNMLPSGHILALHTTLGILALLAYEKDLPYLRQVVQITKQEMKLLLPLLESFPNYCPYETLYANFHKGTTEEVTVARCRNHLYHAVEKGLWRQEMHLIQITMSRLRYKMAAFGINISSYMNAGYSLVLL